MSTLISLQRLRRAVKLCAVGASVAVPVGLFYAGAQPYAVGLIPSPWDKFAHAAVFAVLAAAIGYASGLRGSRMGALAFLGASAVGAMDELHQAWLPGRNAGWDDLAADLAGSLLGTAALLLGRDRAHRWLEEKRVSHR